MASRQPPAKSAERNDYIPTFITQKPFFIDDISTDADYLEHQRLQATPKDTLDKAKWYDRGRKAGPAATKYRKGACENCGAMTHKTKECLSRPRKTGAKWTGRDIQADEVVEDVKLGWDAKRDRWNGYDSREYATVVKEFEELESLRQSAKSASSKPADGGEEGEDDAETSNNHDEDDSEARYGEETDMGRSQPTSTRQLRLREDTAKYLLNLDLDSAKYDPKTRSMDTTSQQLSKTNGDTSTDPTEEGFVRSSNNPYNNDAEKDDAAAFERAQRYAWETQESNPTNTATTVSTTAANDNAKKLHLQANPTEGEFLLKKRQAETNAKKQAHQKALMDKYGDSPTSSSIKQQISLSLTSSTMQPPPNQTSTMKQKPKPILSSSSYIEYDSQGNPLPAFQSNPSSSSVSINNQKIKPKSKYTEDIYPQNHTSVFGSWWRDFQWGYRCCHSTVRNSYCTGEAGRLAFEVAEGMRVGRDLVGSNDSNGDNGGGGVNGEVGGDEEEVVEVKGKKGDKEEKKSRNTNKRPFADAALGISEEEMEAYKRSKMAADDPMRAFAGGNMGDDGLLEQR